VVVKKDYTIRGILISIATAEIVRIGTTFHGSIINIPCDAFCRVWSYRDLGENFGQEITNHNRLHVRG
jgi:hypothetical protein